MSPIGARDSLRVLILLDGLWVGGTERSVAEMLPYLVQAGIEPLIACFRRRPDEGVETEVLTRGYDVRFLPSRGILSQAVALRRLIRAEQPHLVHSALFHANLVARFAQLGLPVKLLSSLVNTPYVDIRRLDPRLQSWRLGVVRRIDAFTGRLLTDHFHAVSNAAKKEAVKSLGIAEDRITVVPRGRDPERLGDPSPARRRRARQNLGLDSTDRVLVNVGRQEYQKGQRYLLEAVADLASEFPGLKLLIAGRAGSVSPALEALRERLGLTERVLFLGHRDDLPEILSAGDVFVFPSLFEGLPGAVIEAMALGLPIVASDIPSLHEVVEPDRNALLVEPASSSACARAVRELLANPSLALVFGQRSSQIFRERFVIDRRAAQMLSLYETVAERPQPQQPLI